MMTELSFLGNYPFKGKIRCKLNYLSFSNASYALEPTLAKSIKAALDGRGSQ